MQYTDDNMDDLFRKAAEHYSPKPDEDRWDEIAPQLFAKPVVSAAPFALKNRKYKKLFLLLPFAAALLGAFVLNDGLDHADKRKTLLSSQQLQRKMPDSSLTKKHGNSELDNNSNQQSKSLLYGINTTGNNTNFKPDNNTSDSRISNIDRPNDKTDVETVAGDSLDILSDSVATGSSLSNALEAKLTANIDSINSSSSTVQKITSAKKAKLYAGIVAGSAFNQVKNQGFKKAGFDIGLMAGYRLSKKASLEAAVIYSKKSYFSDGRYFSMSKMPTNMKVISLTGSSHVFEVPVVVKYNLIQKKSSGVFAVAGLSSYLLTKENNNYVAIINGTQQNIKGEYKNLTAGVASSVHLGIGYEHDLGRQMNLRAEPYLQIPLKGIGVGNMQVMSAGVHVAVTLPVH